MDDQVLVVAAKRGDLEAFKNLMGRYQNLVFSVVRKMVSSHQEAEDLTQEIWIRVFRKIRKLRSAEQFKAWILRITFNLVIDHKKKPIHFQLDDTQCESVDDEETQSDPLQCLLVTEKQNQVRLAIRSLNATDQILAYLHYIEEMSLKEIAEIIRVNHSAVKTRLFRLRQKMRLLILEMRKGVSHGK